MAFQRVLPGVNCGYYTGPTEDRNAQINKVGIGSLWFDETDGYFYSKTTTGTWKQVKSKS